MNRFYVLFVLCLSVGSSRLLAQPPEPHSPSDRPGLNYWEPNSAPPGNPDVHVGGESVSTYDHTTDFLQYGNDSVYGHDPWHYHDTKHDRVDTHGPAFLFGDHVHESGEWMVEYRYSNMLMDGNRAGTNSLTDQQALDFIGTVPPGVVGVSAYGATPTSMTMEMHMIHIMRGVTDNVTAYVMPMWMVNTMDHLRRNKHHVYDEQLGLTAIFASGPLWRIYDGCTDEVILNLGLSAPTGDIDGVTSIPTGTPGEFPYPMRLGHGTWDARPAITYKSYTERTSVGMQASFLLPMGTNDSSYRVGNEYQAHAWFNLLLGSEKRLAASFRISGLWRSNYVGADPQLNPNVISTSDPDMRGGEFLNIGYGLMYMLRCGGRASVEMTNPLSQNLRGVQLGEYLGHRCQLLQSFLIADRPPEA